MNSDIEEIKSRLDIVDVINGYVKLEKAGINYRARCPFHNEKTPSFFVSPARQMWHCFGGCNEGGDMFKFIMKIEGVEFPEALKMLAIRAGVELHERTGESKKIMTERQILGKICESACRFFTTQLAKSKTGEAVRNYLHQRGLKDETVKSWRLGYAPAKWEALSEFLIGSGYKREDIVNAGLAIRKEDKFFDRFRGRIMFPIFDLNSRVIGFTGRVFEGKEDDAKYMNTPNTLLYDKSRALYGFDKAKLELRKKDACVLVEGNVDCIMSHQASVDNCIAVSGTALTPLHLNIIKRYTSNLILAFDMDLAGSKATARGIDMALKGGFSVKVIERVSEKDPADIVLLEGDAKWQSLVERAKPINDFYFSLAFKGRDPEKLEDKMKIIHDFLPIVKGIGSDIEQSYWIEKLSHDLKIKEEDIRSEMRKVAAAEAPVPEKEETAAEKKPRAMLLEEALLEMIILDRGKASLVSEETVSAFSVAGREVFSKLKEGLDLSSELSFSPELSNWLSYLILSAERMKGDGIDLEKEWNEALSELDGLLKKRERDKITDQIKDLEEKGLFDQVRELLEKFNKLTKK